MTAVGVILKSKGLKGEVKVKPLTFDPSFLRSVTSVFIGGEVYHIASAKEREGFLYLCFDEVLTREASDALRGKEILVDSSIKPALPKGRYFIGDLIGCKIVGESVIGVITDINNYGSADVISFSGDKKGMFPYLNVVVTAVDIESKTVKVNQDEFVKVCVYED